MKLELLSCLPGMYNPTVAYAVISSDVDSLNIHSPECVANWNERVLPFIQQNFSSKFCQLGKFGFEDQGTPISLEIQLRQSSPDTVDRVKEQLQSCLDKVCQQMDYKAKLRFRHPDSTTKADHDYGSSKSIQP